MAVLALRPRDALPAHAPVDPLMQLPTWAREAAQDTLRIIRPALERMELGVSQRQAAIWLASVTAGELTAKTVERWLKQYRRDGVAGLAPQYKGRARTVRGWEAIAAEYFQLPTRPSGGTIAYWLNQRHGFTGVTGDQVNAYKKSLPSHLAETSPQALGRRYYDQNIKPFKLIEKGSVPPGVQWQIDGHRCDEFVAHPRTGTHYRPEFTKIWDKGSGFIVGWSLSDAENAFNTLWTISAAMREHNHAPLFLHADRGSVRAKINRSETSGFLARMGIKPQFAYSARAKGLVEGGWRWYEERCGKLFPTYCGADRTDEGLNRLCFKIEKGLIRLPAQAELEHEIARYVAETNAAIAEGWSDTRAALWESRQRRPLAHPADAIARPADERVVSHWRVRHENRFYQHAALQAYEGRKVRFEYEMPDDACVWVFDLAGRYICTAPLVQKVAGLPTSRIEQQELKSAAAKLKRLDAHRDEALARLHTPIDISRIGEALDAPAHRLPPLPAAKVVNGEALARMREAIAEDESIVEETPETRFARWRALTGSTAEISPTDRAWLTSYETTSEFRGQHLVWSEFNEQ